MIIIIHYVTIYLLYIMLLHIKYIFCFYYCTSTKKPFSFFFHFKYIIYISIIYILVLYILVFSSVNNVI